jgi:hypothetical protein
MEKNGNDFFNFLSVLLTQKQLIRQKRMKKSGRGDTLVGTALAV